MHYWHWIGGGWFMMGIWWLVIIVAAVLVVKWAMDQKNVSTRADSALDVLKRRYASGEISKEEFEEKRNAILH
jgi:putative membrane protein